MSRQQSLVAPSFVASRVGAVRRAAAPGQAVPTAKPSLLRRILLALVAWQEREAARYDALQLDDRTLKDIGVNRFDIAQAMGRPWRRL